jgi:hypothetical protein
MAAFIAVGYDGGEPTRTAEVPAGLLFLQPSLNSRKSLDTSPAEGRRAYRPLTARNELGDPTTRSRPFTGQPHGSAVQTPADRWGVMRALACRSLASSTVSFQLRRAPQLIPCGEWRATAEPILQPAEREGV